MRQVSTRIEAFRDELPQRTRPASTLARRGQAGCRNSTRFPTAKHTFHAAIVV
jgi:hypothetical protein